MTLTRFETPIATGADASLADGVARLLGARIADPDGPGAVLAVVRDGSIVAGAAAGLAVVEHGVPIERETVFHVASVSKQFTAYAATLLADEGAFGIDDRVDRHFDWFPFPDVTVRHLIHHTSGLRELLFLNLLAGRSFEDVIGTEGVLDQVRRQRLLDFAPGSEYGYSNTGYVLLGLLVEQASGVPLDEFCRQRIWGPNGMTSTFICGDYQDVLTGRAESYYTRDGRLRRLALSYRLSGSTSVNTTVDDLAAWIAHMASPEGRDRLERRFTLTDGTEIDYATGVHIGTRHGHRIVGHSGMDAGYRAHLLAVPELGIGAICLVNWNSLEAEELAEQAIDLMLGGSGASAGGASASDAASDAGEVEPPAGSGSGPEAGNDAAEVAGAPDPALAGAYYADEIDSLLHIEHDGWLWVRRTGWGRVPLTAAGPGRYLSAELPEHAGNWNARIRFSPDGDWLELIHARIGAPIRFQRIELPVPTARP